MKRILLKIAIFLILLGIPFVALFLTPYSEEFAYHFVKDDCYNHAAWIYDRIKNNSTPIDVAFVGSSHTIHAFQDKKIEEQLATTDHIVNLGYCRYGRNLEYTILRLLLENKTPKIVIIEVHEDEEMNSHDIFPYLAKTTDLLLSPTPINRDYFSDLFWGASARLEHFRANYIFRKKYSMPNPEYFGYAPSDRTVTEEELTENKKAWQRRLRKTAPASIEKIQLKYPLAYLNKMIDLLRKKNIRFIFVYLPEYGSTLKRPKHIDFYQNAGSLLKPPQFIFNDTSNWMDASHLNDKGSKLISEWITEQLKRELCVE